MSRSLSVRLPALVCLALLAGCSTSPAVRALIDAGGLLRSGGEPVAESRLDPRFAYLRFERGKRVVWLALGYIDPHPDGAVEVWYSSAGEVLRLQDGRVVGSTGGQTDWLSVAFEGRPAWDRVETSASFVRIRDVQPGYRLGLRETLVLRRVAVPADTRLQGLSAEALAWFAERAEGSGLPPSRYGVHFSPDGPRVIYGEHCLSADLCFSWQRWSATAGGAL